MKNKKILALIIFFVAFACVAKAKDVYDNPEVKPIMNMLYPADNEIALKLAYFPIGAFNKHVGLGGTYLKFENPNHAWEVISGYYFFEIPSGLKTSVIDGFGADAEIFPVLKYMVKTGYSYIPFYSKSILFNTYLIHSRSYLNLSAGVSDFKIETPPFISFGYAQNFYFEEGKGVKIELDYVNFFKQSSYIQNQLTISIGMVFSWGANE